MDEAEILASKRALRTAAREARRQLTPEERKRRSEAACERLLALPDIVTAEVVLLYAAMPEELDTGPALRRLLERPAVTVLLPRVNANANELELARAGDPSELIVGYRSIREPVGPRIDPSVVDVVVTPGVAFDLVGGRLGQGSGHYDRLLGQLPEYSARIGLGFTCQLVPRVPTGQWDQLIDVVVTEDRVRETGARSEPAG